VLWLSRRFVLWLSRRFVLWLSRRTGAVKSRIVPVAVLMMVFCTGIRSGYCENLDLYMYSIEDGSKVLLKLQYHNGEWIQLAMTEGEFKQGNITYRILKPLPDYGQGWEKWKADFFSSLAKAILDIQTTDNETLNMPDVIQYRFVNYLKSQTGDGYSAVVKVPELSLDITLYYVNRMFDAQPTDDLLTRLVAFGYGIENAKINEVVRKISDDEIPVVLNPLFKARFAEEVREYISRTYKPGNRQLYIIMLIAAPIMAAIAVVLIILKSGLKAHKIRERATAELREELDGLKLQINSLTENNQSLQQQVADMQKERALIAKKNEECLETALNALNDVRQEIDNRVLEAERRSLAYRVRELLESIGAKVEGRWLDAARSKVSELLPASLTPTGMYNVVPKNVDEFRGINWRDQFLPLLSRLTDVSKQPDADSRRSLEAIGREVVPAIVEAADAERNIHGSADSSLESDLKEMMSLTGIREMDVRSGQIYNPDIHELVIDSNPSLTTDREQRITRVISRGLLLPGGRIVKAKVSIQK